MRYMQPMVPHQLSVNATKSYLEHANDSAIAWDCIMCNCRGRQDDFSIYDILIFSHS
jgi:hypothetical protein